jgi:hypothetical protein
VEVHARVGTRLGLNVALPFEVFEVCVVYGTRVIQVTHFAVNHDLAIDDFEAIRASSKLPALAILAIEQTVPTVGIRFEALDLGAAQKPYGYNDYG